MKRTLAESDNYLLTNEWEYPALFHKYAHKEISLKEHNGDPQCGIITHNEKWCIVGGEFLSVFSIIEETEMVLFTGKEYRIHSIKEVENGKIHVFMDPWSVEHGTWELNPDSLTIKRISEEPNLVGTPYQDIDYGN